MSIGRPFRSTARSESRSPTTATKPERKRRQEHADELMEMGIECYRVQFPKGMDANEYALKVQPAAESAGRDAESRGMAGKGEQPTVP